MQVTGGKGREGGGGRRGQMEEWDVYYLFVRNINVTTNGSWFTLGSHVPEPGNQLSPEREK